MRLNLMGINRFYKKNYEIFVSAFYLNKQFIAPSTSSIEFESVRRTGKKLKGQLESENGIEQGLKIGCSF